MNAQQRRINRRKLSSLIGKTAVWQRMSRHIGVVTILSVSRTFHNCLRVRTNDGTKMTVPLSELRNFE